MGRLGWILVLALLVAGPALATGGTTRHYLWHSGSEGRSAPDTHPLATVGPEGAHFQREDGQYFMRMPIARDTVVTSFHLHLAEHEAFLDGDYATRVVVRDEDDANRVLSDETFAVTLPAGVPSGTVAGWTDYALDAVAGNGFSAFGDGVLVPAGTVLLLVVELAEAPSPEFEMTLLRDAGQVVSDARPSPVLDERTAALADEAWARCHDFTRRCPGSLSTLVNGIGENLAPFFDTFPDALADGIERTLGSPVPEARFRYVSDDDASWLAVETA